MCTSEKPGKSIVTMCPLYFNGLTSPHLKARYVELTADLLMMVSCCEYMAKERRKKLTADR